MEPIAQTTGIVAPNLETSKRLIGTVDLTQVIDRLIYVDKWFRKDAIEAVKLYRNFLYLKRKYGNEYALPPSKEIDEVWHAHVLHTEDYIEFCNKAFGYYLHHHPHLVKEASSLEEINKLFTKTQEFYHTEFSDYLYAFRFLKLKRLIKSVFGKSVAQAKG